MTSYEDVADLKSDPEWRVGYLESVRLCALAWGWDVDTGARVPPDQRHRTQGWSDWDVRLAKMIRSLWIFEVDLYDAIAFGTIFLPFFKQFGRNSVFIGRPRLFPIDRRTIFPP